MKDLLQTIQTCIFFCLNVRKFFSEVCGVVLQGLLKHSSERGDVVDLEFGVAQWL